MAYIHHHKVPTIIKPVAELGTAYYPVERRGETFIHQLTAPQEAITGSFYGARTLTPDDIREYAQKLIELADLVDEINNDIKL